MDTTPYTIINNAHEYTVEGLNRETRYYVYLKSSCDTTWLEDSVITRGLAGEESVIVAEGTTHNRYLPIYGNYFDEPIACQSVYPASLLTSLTGKSITRLHYFVYSGNGTAWTDTKPMTVKIKVVGDTLLSAYNTLENAVTVFNGVCVGSTVNSTNGFDIVFDQPYTYTGGNLLVSFQANPNAADGYDDVNFYGITTDYASSRYGKGSNAYSLHGGTAQNFLPKVEVFYAVLTEACPAVTALFADSITNTSASISWTASDADYCIGNQIIVSPIPLDSAELDTTTPTTSMIIMKTICITLQL